MFLLFSINIYGTDKAGGLAAASEAEQQELLVIRREKDAADERNFRAMEELMLEGCLLSSLVCSASYFPKKANRFINLKIFLSGH